MFGFRGRERDDLDVRLRRLESQAYGTTDTGADAVYLNQAGDLCLAADRPLEALDYYGQAVDSYVKGDRFDSAAAVCKKIIRLSPRVVRARCTLAWMAIGKGFLPEAQQFVTHYVVAAELAGREPIARHQVKRMCIIADAEPLRLFLAERLLDLGDARSSDQLLGAIYRERNGYAATRRAPARKRWQEARRCALMTLEQLGGT